MTFTESDKLKALAIVNVFETSHPFGDYAACVVLDDGAGVSYGINQFTHRSGSLAEVVDEYLELGGTIGAAVLSAAQPTLRRPFVSSINKLAGDEQFKKALRAAAVTRQMKEAQRRVAFERYLRPAIAICETNGFIFPLSLAVVYDSLNHGSWSQLSRKTGILPDRDRKATMPDPYEKSRVREYIRRRHLWLSNIKRLAVTNYRTKFFLDQIAIGNWELCLPMTVHGLKLTEAMFAGTEAEGAAAGEDASEPGAVATGSQLSDKTNPDASEQVSDATTTIANRFDQINNAVTAVTSRTDSVKSLWTTILGTISQAAWAVFGFVTGLPKEVWITVAVIAAILTLLYMYRQIELGRIREGRSQ
ncbi:hypothetical protein BH10ACI3_BH10ACI3_23160 [soil metagenome]